MLIASLRAGIAGIIALVVYHSLRSEMRQVGRQETFLVLFASRAYTASEIFSLIYMQIDVNLLTLIKGKLTAGVYSPALSVINLCHSQLSLHLFNPHPCVDLS